MVKYVPKWPNFQEPRYSNQNIHINGLVQERHNSTALAVELCLSCTNPSICFFMPLALGTRNIMFSGFSIRLSVCLSVCLSVRTTNTHVTDWVTIGPSFCLEASGHFLENTKMNGLWCAGISWPPLWINFGLCFLIFLFFHNFDLMKQDKCCVHKIMAWWCLMPQIQIMFSNERGIVSVIGRTVPLLKPPQSPHCHLEAVDHAKNFLPTPSRTAILGPILPKLH